MNFNGSLKKKKPSLNIKTCAGLFQKINEFNVHKITNNLPLIEISGGLVYNPDYLRPDIFPNEFFDEDFDQMIKFSPTKYLSVSK